MNQELRALFVADQAERNDHPAYNIPENWQLRQRDAGRRQRVNELIAQGFLTAPDDYFHAALIFQHKAPAWMKEALERWEQEDS